MKKEIKSEYDTKNESHIICPHCGYEFKDSWEYVAELNQHAQTISCHSCGKEFECEMQVSTTYTTTKG